MSTLRFKNYDLSKIAEIRRSRGENQHAFWSRFGVTQSGGSRYESGRKIPTPVAALIQLFLNEVIDDKMLAKAVKAV